MRHVKTNSQIVGIATAVPKNEFKNIDYQFLEKNKLENLIKLTGIYSKRIANSKTCTSDLAINAGDKLLSDLKWKKSDIEFIIFITQTADYLTPATSGIIQNRLGLKNDIFAIDINLGCSGFPYGIFLANSFVDNYNFKKGLLFIGDVCSRLCNIKDNTTWPIFGDACSAVAFEKGKKQKIFFDFFSDGSKYNDIIVPTHSFAGRNELNSNQLEEINNDNKRNEFNMHLNGANIYSFAISKVPERIKNLIEYSKINKQKIKYCFLHQANRLINETIEKKINLKNAKFLSSLDNFGNTSSASITMTITKHFAEKKISGISILCGFGVGISLSTMILNFKRCYVSSLSEI